MFWAIRVFVSIEKCEGGILELLLFIYFPAKVHALVRSVCRRGGITIKQIKRIYCGRLWIVSYEKSTQINNRRKATKQPPGNGNSNIGDRESGLKYGTGTCVCLQKLANNGAWLQLAKMCAKNYEQLISSVSLCLLTYNLGECAKSSFFASHQID